MNAYLICCIARLNARIQEMAQVKIYGQKHTLHRFRIELSDSIHKSVVSAFKYPIDKRFHRFIALDSEDFIYPSDRSGDYIILEISIFEGRTLEAKKRLIRELFKNISHATGIAEQDIEITISETPRGNWGIRGMTGDELLLGYKVDV